jgi:RNA ligase (TIGR02306 family)
MINSKGERALAHIELISDIQPIEGADKIEVCTVLGWKVVIAKKDNFKVGDKAVYIEVDSKVPDDRECFSFLSDRKYRVKTIRLKGQ